MRKPTRENRVGFVHVSKLVNPPGRRERLALAVRFQPQSRFDALADLHQPRDRWLAHQFLAIGRRNREDQLEVLAVAERVLQRALPGRAAQFDRGARHRDRARVQHRAAMALFQDVIEVGREAVADVAHGVQFDRGVQSQRFANSRREVEMVSENAAAERAGDEQPVARLRAGTHDRPATGRLRPAP